MAAKMAATKKSSETVIFPWRGKGYGGEMGVCVKDGCRRDGGKVVNMGGEGLVVKCGEW
jgi:hypothetical protein